MIIRKNVITTKNELLKKLSLLFSYCEFNVFFKQYNFMKTRRAVQKKISVSNGGYQNIEV